MQPRVMENLSILWNMLVLYELRDASYNFEINVAHSCELAAMLR